MILPPILIAFGGLVIGIVVGYTARRANLCTLGAIEAALVGRDWRRMKVFGLALAIALLLTQGLILAKAIDPSASSYLPTKVAFFSIFIGGLSFGLGMALVGTCGFGSLLRLGGGDLRSLVTIIVYAIFATMVLRGALSDLRIEGLERIAIAMPQESPSSFIDLAERLGLPKARWWLTALFVVLLGLPALIDPGLRGKKRLMRAGWVLGLGIAGGWFFTGAFNDPFENAARVQSLTFVSPVARGFHALVFGSREWLEFGITSVIGVVFGANIAALRAEDMRWEAFDDHVEMRRHLIGATFMGIGGVLAGGCTIGQGLTAGSLLAVSWPVAVIGILIGARAGLSILISDSFSDFIRNLRPDDEY